MPTARAVHVGTGELLKQTHTKGDVVMMDIGNGVGFWNTMPTFARSRRYPESWSGCCRHRAEFHLPTLFRVQFKHFIEGTQQRRFTQPDGPINAVTWFLAISRLMFSGHGICRSRSSNYEPEFYSGSFNHTHCNLFLIVPDALRYQAYRRPDKAFTPHPAKC